MMYKKFISGLIVFSFIGGFLVIPVSLGGIKKVNAATTTSTSTTSTTSTSSVAGYLPAAMKAIQNSPNYSDYMMLRQAYTTVVRGGTVSLSDQQKIDLILKTTLEDALHIVKTGDHWIEEPKESFIGILLVIAILFVLRSQVNCLAEGTLIDTPSGVIAVQNLKKNSIVWTTNISGERVPGKIVKVAKTPVKINHQVVRLVTDDGRELFVSPGHPTADGRLVSQLSVGEFFDGARIISTDRVSYKKKFTYDILPSGNTGTYWANGILMGSTLFHGK